MNSAGRRYLKIVRTYLPCSRKMKDTLTSNLRTRIEEQEDRCPNLTYADLISELGAPESIAANCVMLDDMSTVLKDMQLRKRLHLLAATCVLLAAILWGVAVMFAVRKAQVREFHIVPGASVFDSFDEYMDYVEDETANDGLFPWRIEDNNNE